MRRYYLLIGVVLLLLSGCDVNESMRSKAKDGATADARALAAKGGCMGCHTVSNSIYGPAWKMVSKHYQDVPEARATLIEHINSGSHGRWDHITGGKRTPPQKGALNDEELALVVDYILGLASR